VDWKRWYAEQARSDRGRALVAESIARVRADDPLRAALSRGGAASFPHVTLESSADALARVAVAVLAGEFERVLALGVLHGSTAPEAYRPSFAAAVAGDEDALARVGGAFVEESFDGLPRSRRLRVGGDLLREEFSLDLFGAVLDAAAVARGEAPPPLVRAYVGPTTTESGSIAAEVADALRPLVTPRTALVATGDLVHAGHGYSTDEETAALPLDRAARRAGFLGEVSSVLEGTLRGGSAARAADEASRRLRSDMRHVLPVLAALLGPGARAEVLAFDLADYAPILGRPDPCEVASALVMFERR
jgi:hypothetical protein